MYQFFVEDEQVIPLMMLTAGSGGVVSCGVVRLTLQTAFLKY